MCFLFFYFLFFIFLSFIQIQTLLFTWKFYQIVGKYDISLMLNVALFYQTLLFAWDLV